MRGAIESAPFGNCFDGIVRRQKLLLGLLKPIGQQILMRGTVDVFTKAANEMRRAHAAQGRELVERNFLLKMIADVLNRRL